MFVLSLLSSDLAAGFRSQWMNEEERTKLRDPTSSYYQTWSNLEKKLQETFRDSAEEQRARSQIVLLKQNKKTALDFFTEFEKLKYQAGYTDEQDPVLIQLLRSNVNSAIIDRIIDSDLLPTSYEEWKRRILRIDQAWRDHQLEKRSGGSFNPKSAKGDSRPTNQNNPAPSGSTSAELPPGEPMNVDRRKSDITCYKCQQKGHIARNCPTNKARGRSMMEELRSMIVEAVRQAVRGEVGKNVTAGDGTVPMLETEGLSQNDVQGQDATNQAVEDPGVPVYSP